MKKLFVALVGLILLSGCATQTKESYDYSEFKKSNPKSILMVMPANHSVDVKAEASVLARASYPLAEKGYYVYPVALVDEVFKQNGLADGHAIRGASLKKIREIFGADAIFYVNVNEYGTSYKLIDSVTKVALHAKLVDLKTEKVLWEGAGSYTQGSTSSNDGLLTALVKAAVSQIIDTNKDYGYQVAAPAMRNLIYSGTNGGLLVAPKHPLYGTQQ